MEGIAIFANDMKHFPHILALILAGAGLFVCGNSACQKTGFGKDSAYTQSTDRLCRVRDGRLLSPEGEELSLLGVNFQTPLSWEANRLEKAGLAINAATLREVTDRNLDDVLLLGAGMLRCHLTPADFTDGNGNLLETPFLDALDYLVFRAGEKGLYLSLAFLNHMGVPGPGTAWIGQERESWIIDTTIVRKTKNYIRQLVERKNPYSGLTYKETPAIAYWELINEPALYAHSEIGASRFRDVYASWLKKRHRDDTPDAFARFRTETVRDYIDGMVDLLRSLGDGHPVCWGLNWHRYRKGNSDIFDGAAASKADIVAFCNYPGQDLVEQDYYRYTHNLSEEDFTSWFNDNRKSPNGYGWVMESAFATKAKVVYEFETFFNLSAYLYPVQAVYFKSLSAQTGSMWTYTFSEIAEYFGGSHFLNIRCTPAKAASFVVAGQIFKEERCGIGTTISQEMEGAHWCISRSRNCAVYADGTTYCNSGPVPDDWNPRPPTGKEKQIAGVGNSPLVKYEGSGLYLIEDTGSELYLTLMPDVHLAGNPYARAGYDAKVTLLDSSCQNGLSVLLDAWKHRRGQLFRVNGSERTFVETVDGTASLRLSPGKYVILPAVGHSGR